MAKKRMFSVDIVGSDAFLDLPHTAQALYFQLGMRADDDGFVGNPKTIQRMAGTKLTDLELLIEKRFLLQFPSGVVCIKHWRMNNQIQKDRYTPTVYTEEFQMLSIKENKSYTEVEGKCIQSVSNVDTQIRLDKIRLDKDRLVENKRPYGHFKNVLLTDDELEKLKQEVPHHEEWIERLSEYMASKGKRYKSHYATIRTWHRKEQAERQQGKTGQRGEDGSPQQMSVDEQATIRELIKRG